MAMRIQGRPKNSKDIDIINACKGMRDATHKIPFEVIHLDWKVNRSRHQKQYAKTRGFESTMIKMTPRGPNITHQVPGNAQWMKHQLTKRLTAMIAKTPHNMYMLANTFYDGLWIIREEHIRIEVEAMAKKQDEQLGTEEVVHLDKMGDAKVGKSGGELKENRLTYEKRRRKALNMQHIPGQGLGPVAVLDDDGEFVGKPLESEEEEDLSIFQVNLEEQAVEETIKEEILNPTVTMVDAEGLKNMNITNLKKLARDTFDIPGAFGIKENKIAKPDLIQMILDEQEKRIAERPPESAEAPKLEEEAVVA